MVHSHPNRQPVAALNVYAKTRKLFDSNQMVPSGPRTALPESIGSFRGSDLPPFYLSDTLRDTIRL